MNNWLWKILPAFVENNVSNKSTHTNQIPAETQVHSDYHGYFNTEFDGSRIVLVAHDAQPHGAQFNVLHQAKVLSEDLGFTVDMIVLGEGPLISEYARFADIHMLAGKSHRGEEAKELVANLYSQGVRSAIANTTVTGLFVEVLKAQGFYTVVLVHELPGIIREYSLEEHVRSIAEQADLVFFPAEQVREGFNSFSKVPSHRSCIRPQGCYKKNSLSGPVQSVAARQDLRKRFNLPTDSYIVLCVGYADYRKGIDLFVDIGIQVIREKKNIYFLWIGHFDLNLEQDIKTLIAEYGLTEHFLFPGLDYDTDVYYAGADIYALTSREDPYPSVVMEALDARLPVIAFRDTGGFTDLLSRGGGVLVEMFDTTAYARAIMDLIHSPTKAYLLGQSGKEIVDRELSFRRYTFDLAVAAQMSIRRVSVIIPNYNYARYLSDRINSVISQEYPVYEIIFLDDASTDGSVALFNQLIHDVTVDCQVVVNKSNSGNPFMQWLKGVELARGDYVWIAGAGDCSESGFLEEVLKPFDDPSVCLSYCESKQMNSDGVVLCDNYHDYVSDISNKKWLEPYLETGGDEINTCLAIKNTIPNVSGVVFKRKTLQQVLRKKMDEIKSYQMAGDWMTYLLILRTGKVAFSPEPLNLHRRHQDNIILGNSNMIQLEEILSVQKYVRETCRLDEEVIAQAKSYSQRLYEEFKLATPETPVLDEHSTLASYLRD